MIIFKDDKLTHVDSSVDILEHYGVKGMKWGKHMSNMSAAKNKQRATYGSLNDDRTNYRHGYGIGYSIGAEAGLTKARNTDFRKYANEKANNRISVKKQKYIDKYSTDDTTKSLNAKGKKKYDRLKKKANKLSDKYYNDIEKEYQRTKYNYRVSMQ